MTPVTPSCPMSRSAVVDAYFMEHRAKLLDIAAYLDRLDRSPGDAAAAADHRVPALLAALKLLTDGQGDRARRVLELLSDPTLEPIPKAPGKGATGAYKA